MEYLLQQGAKITETNDQRYNAFLYAARNNKPRAVEYILSKYGSLIDVNQRTIDFFAALHFAAFNGYQELMEILLKFGANPNISDKDDFTPMHMCAQVIHHVSSSLLFVFSLSIYSHTVRVFSSFSSD